MTSRKKKSDKRASDRPSQPAPLVSGDDWPQLTGDDWPQLEPAAPGELRPRDDYKSVFSRVGRKIRNGTIGDATYVALVGTVIPALNARHAKRPRMDRLQELIVSIVKLNPKITATELREQLKSTRGDVIMDCDGDDEGNFYFYVDEYSSDDSDCRTKSAPMSGLKDRLSRAKKYINSR